MIHSMLTPPRIGASRDDMRKLIPALTLTAIAFGAAGCVQVRAPDKPIEINLNVTIRQEVIVRLEKDVQDLISSNPGVF